MVYACFVAKMSKMAFTRFGGQFQFEKSMLGRLDNSGAGYKPHPNVRGVSKERYFSNFHLISVLEVRFYFSTCVL